VRGGRQVKIRWRWLSIVLMFLGVVSVSLSMSSAQTGAGLRKVRIGMSAGATLYLPMWVGREMGFFKKHGIEEDLVLNDVPVRPLVAGDMDVDFVSPPQVLQVAAQGFDAQIFMTLQDRIGQVLIVRSNLPLQHKPGEYPAVVQELRGKRLGVTVHGGAVDFNLRYELIAAGLDPDKDVEIVNTGGLAQLRAAFESGQLDGFQSLQPATAIALNSGKGRGIINLAKGEGPPLLDQPWTVGFAKRDYIEKNTETVRRLEAAFVETIRFMKDPANQSAVDAIEKKDVYPNGDPQTIRSIVEEINSIMTRFKYTETDFNRAKDFIKQVTGPLKRDLTAKQIISPIQPVTPK
jgi:ABC-type nitrate/sulfonate/bicarbonate transport system substrate-binding protein